MGPSTGGRLPEGERTMTEDESGHTTEEEEEARKRKEAQAAGREVSLDYSRNADSLGHRWTANPKLFGRRQVEAEEDSLPAHSLFSLTTRSESGWVDQTGQAGEETRTPADHTYLWAGNGVRMLMKQG